MQIFIFYNNKMTILLTGMWRNIPSYEHKINTALEEVSDEIKLSEDLVDTIMDKFNYKNWVIWKDELLKWLKEYINNEEYINFEEVNTILDEKLAEEFKPDKEWMTSILNKNINILYNQLQNWSRIDKKSLKIIKGLVIQIVLSQWYERMEERTENAENQIANIAIDTKWHITEIL